MPRYWRKHVPFWHRVAADLWPWAVLFIALVVGLVLLATKD